VRGRTTYEETPHGVTTNAPVVSMEPFACPDEVLPVSEPSPQNGPGVGRISFDTETGYMYDVHVT
jgi:hypothetical protein